jgi:hypothetical protein
MEVQVMTFESTESFQFDLTDEQRQLCDWVARQVGTGVRRICYEDARAALDVPDERLTHLLRDMRERLDSIHEMVQFPILNAREPYFEVPLDAGHIWDRYRRAEQEMARGQDARATARPQVAVSH